MKKAFVFPGQGAQFVGMGKDLYENSPEAKELFEKANEILGFRITDLMWRQLSVPVMISAMLSLVLVCMLPMAMNEATEMGQKTPSA